MASQLDTLTKKRDQLNARIQAMKQRQQAQQRKDDTRRKILIGSMVLEHLDKGTWSTDRFRAAMDAYLHRDRDRALFDLPPRPPAPETAS